MQISAEVVALIPPGGTQGGPAHELSPAEWRTSVQRHPELLGTSGKSFPVGGCGTEGPEDHPACCEVQIWK